MPTAYFDADGVCVGVSELPLVIPEGGQAIEVAFGTPPNAIHINRGEIAASEPMSLDIPESLEAPGPNFVLALPSGVIANVDGERQVDQLVVQLDQAREVSIVIKWRMTGTACLKVQTYASKRRDAYPAIGDQLDAIWKALGQSDVPPDMLEQIQAVKEAFPKPEAQS